MKKCYLLLCLGVVLAMPACVKDKLQPLATVKNDNATPAVEVSLIAGGDYSGGSTYVDGKGKDARFGSNPGGISEAVDGTLYFADVYNHAIRKIAPDGTVSTFTVPASVGLDLPNDVYISANNSLFITYSKTDFKFYLTRIDPNGSVFPITVPAGRPHTFMDLEFNKTDDTFLAASYPYFFHFSTAGVIGKQIKIQQGMFRVDDYNYKDGPRIPALATSGTGDRYFTGTYGKHIYLKDSNNNFKEVFKTFKFTNITSLAVSNDGVEIYVTDDGNLKKICTCDNSITTLVKKVVGETPLNSAAEDTSVPVAGARPLDSHIPLFAYADHLTISRDGKYVYFTSIADFSTTINKIKIH